MRPAIQFLALMTAAMLAAPALAKLPALSEEAKAKAAEAAAKTAWSGNVDAYQLCKAQDRIAAKYRTSAAAVGKAVGAVSATPPCIDPGAFAYAPAAAKESKPLEAAGAHSPPATAASPPSTLQPAAAATPTPKAQ